MKTHLYLLSATILLISCTKPHPPRDITFIIAADTHFDPAPETDQYYHIVTMNNLPGTLVWNNNIKMFAGDTLSKIDGVIIAGDIFDKPTPVSMKLFKERYEEGKGDRRIHFPVYPSYGNHDINPYNEDKQKNIEGRNFALKYMDSLLNAKLATKEILNLHPSSRAYSWNVGDVHFINMQTYAGDTTYAESNMQWLKDDLLKYASNGNPLVYTQHYGIDSWAIKWWTPEKQNELFSLLKKYNLAAFFVGHTHTASIEKYNGTEVYQVNNAWKDEDGNGSFAVLRIKGNTVGIVSCRWTDDKGNYEIVAPFLERKIK